VADNAPPAEETIDVAISYATRFLRRRPEQLAGKRAALIAAHEPVWRFGVVLAVEHDRWIVTQGGYFDDMPGSGDGAFLDFARTLAAPDIAELLTTAEPLTAPVEFFFRQAGARTTSASGASRKATSPSAMQCAASIRSTDRE
jgi:hypothetical protein